MTREEKLEAIYEEIANKELTFGCKAKHTTKRWLIYDVVMIWQMIDWEKYFVVKDTLDYDVEWVYENDWVITFVWHPVMIGSVFERYSASKWFINAQFVMELIDKWTAMINPIDDQSDECIDYVYSLIQKS